MLHLQLYHDEHQFSSALSDATENTYRKTFPTLYLLATFRLNTQGRQLSTSKGMEQPMAAVRILRQCCSSQLSAGCLFGWSPAGVRSKQLSGQCSTYIEVTNEDLISTQIIPNYESRDLRVHDPVQHSNLFIYDWTKIRIKVDGHHSVICGGCSADVGRRPSSNLTR